MSNVNMAGNELVNEQAANSDGRGVILYLRATLLYAVASFGIVLALRGFDAAFLRGVGDIAANHLSNLGAVLLLLLALLLPALSMAEAGQRGRVLILMAATAAATSVFQIAFSLFKSSVPLMVAFHADPALAEIDRVLHGGQDAWQLYQGWLAWLPVSWIAPTYFVGFALSALGFMVLVAALDRDEPRIRRHIFLSIFCWIVLGNLLTLVASSAGPVFYDGLLNSDRFAEFDAFFSSSGLAGTQVGDVSNYLWTSYSLRSSALGSGISAFPSIHVAIATQVMLYLGERSRLLLLPGLLNVAMTQALSVYTGFHYGIDGYASIVLTILAWLAIGKLQRKGLL